MEEERFSSTLSQGMKLLNQEIESNQGKVLSGSFVFKLYDTYGFPIDLTKDIVKNIGLDIDQVGFDEAMAKQKSMARKANQFSQEENIQLNHQLQTLFLGYEQMENYSKVIGIFKDRAFDVISEGEMGQIILEETAFYAESGGQIGDVGSIVSKNGIFDVIDTQHSGNAQVHIGSVSTGSISLGDEVKVSINPIKRSSITSNHTGTHLLHAALMNILGDHVTQRGSLVDDMKIRFDFSHDQAVSSEQIREIEAIVNSKIEENIEVETSIMKHDEAIDSGAMALFGEKYGDDVRVLEVGKFSKELCGGTHVKNTNEISLFKVVSESSVSSGTRRIEAITGDQALKWAEETEHLVEQLTDLLKIRREDVTEKVTTLVETNRKMSQEIKDLKARVAGSQDNDNSVKPEIINGISLIIKALDDDTEAGIMRTAIDQMKNNLGSGVIVLSSLSSKGKIRLAIGVTQDLKEKIPANELAKEMSEALGGKGGGRSDFANAGGTNPDNIEQAISILKERLTSI
jgi:alanyl-tRNA synthetase